MSKALSSRTLCLTSLAMLAFARNSLLCRLALKTTSIDAISFTSLRLVAGALMLWLLLRWRNGGGQLRGNWRSAAALFTYAAAFSLAYLHLDAGTGALLLFGAVQTSMLLQGVLQGERPDRAQLLGFVLALGGLLALLLPGASAPDRDSALLMLLAGVAWGLYSLLGRGTREPLAASAGNFLRTLPFVAVLLLAYWPDVQGNALGVLYAVLSGALTSGVISSGTAPCPALARFRPPRCNSVCPFWRRWPVAYCSVKASACACCLPPWLCSAASV